MIAPSIACSSDTRPLSSVTRRSFDELASLLDQAHRFALRRRQSRCQREVGHH
jgi:hypothetical protein